MNRVLLTIVLAMLSGAAQAQNITRVSVATDGTEGNGISGKPCIDSSGRYVAFQSTATNLVPSDTNAVADVFVHDRLSGETTRVSVNSFGWQSNGQVEDTAPSISSDGRFVAFSSEATNLVPFDFNHTWDVFVHDRVTRKTFIVSVSRNGDQGDGPSFDPSISADGRYVSFTSLASDLVLGDTNGTTDVFVHDRQTGETSRVNVSSDKAQANDSSGNSQIGANAPQVVSSSTATNLIPIDSNGWGPDVFAHDLQTGQTSLVSQSTDGVQGDSWSDRPDISGDGRYVAFDSLASTLVLGDTNEVHDVFVHDRETGETVRVSVASDGSQGNGGSIWASISPDGRFVGFSSGADNLVPGDTNDEMDVFLHDLRSKDTRRITMAFDGEEASDQSWNPVLSWGAKQVAFWSFATNLVSADTNGSPDVFVYDSMIFADGFESGDTSAWSSSTHYSGT